MLPPPAVLASFALVAMLVTVTPGLDTVLVLRTAAVAGRPRAIGAVAGICGGTLVWGALAAGGVGAILLASETAYLVLRIAGACYLVWIGGRMLVAAVRGGVRADRPAPPVRTVGAGVRQGLLTNLTNPKIGAFYVALLPQFIPAGAPALLWGVCLAAVHAALGAVWLTVLALLATRVRAVLARPRVTRAVDGVAGTAIVGFGVALALEPAR